MPRNSIVDYSEPDKVSVRSSLEIRILIVILWIGVGILGTYYWSALGLINRGLVGAFSIVLTVGTLDYFQKIYLFEAQAVSRRFLFRWHRFALPEAFEIRLLRSGSYVFYDLDNDSVVLSIGRELASPTMIQALRTLYGFSSVTRMEIGEI